MIVKSTVRKNRAKLYRSIEASRRAMTRMLVEMMEYATDEELRLALVPEQQASCESVAEDGAADDETEAQVDEAARAVMAYTLRRGTGERLRAVKTRCVWGHEDVDISPSEFTERAVVLMADAHPSHLRHVILADPYASLDQVMTHLRTLYGPAASISLTQHGDTDHPHFHAVILTVDPATGKGFQINNSYDIEALHMLAAAIDFENSASPEPNALYLADDAGIYDRWTGARVASKEFEVDGGAAAAARRNRDRIMAANEANENADERWLRYRAETEGLDILGPEWDDERVAAEMIVPRIKRAKSWDELHDSLAMIGVQYVQYRGNGRLLLGDERSMAASAAISTASMTELARRFNDTFTPLSQPERVRPFVYPRFTMRKAEARDAQKRKDAKAAVDAEAKAIAERAEEELLAMRKGDRKRAEDFIRKVAREAKADHAKRSKLNDNRRKVEQASEMVDLAASDQPGAIAWQSELQRINQKIEVYAGYTRTQHWGAKHWRRNGDLEFVEYRTMITAMKGSDKLNMLRLSQIKWGENFRVFGSRREISAYCRIAAENGIVFGDAKQRDMIAGYRMGMAGSAKSRPLASQDFTDRLNRLTASLNARLSAARAHFEDTVLKRDAAGSSGQHESERIPPRAAPSDRRAMIRVQQYGDRADEVVRDYEQPVGQSIEWLQSALALNPEDLQAPLLQGALLADYFAQRAQRDILLVMVSRGDAAVRGDRVVCLQPRAWTGPALERENQNPEFLREVFSRRVPDIMSEEPEIEAFVSARASHPLHDLSVARLELAFRLAQKAGKGRQRSPWFGALSAADRAHVEQAIRDAPNSSPTFVVDKTLIKNMTPAQRHWAQRNHH